MFGAALRRRIDALEGDLKHLRDEAALKPRWERELRETLDELKHVDHSRPLPRDGFDCLASVPPERLQAAGGSFVLRYLKALSRDEADEIGARGLDLGLIFENEAARALQGYAAGAKDAKEAERQANAVGRPAGRGIYFAVDFDMQPGQGGQVDDYFRGVRDVLPGQVGIYGGIAALELIHWKGHARFYWQTLAWSAGRWAPFAQLRQVAIERLLGSWRVDVDRAYAADFGQWRPA